MNKASYLIKQGLSIRLENKAIIVKPKYLITDQIRLYVKTFRKELIQELTYITPVLTIAQQRWLNQIAHYLQVTPDFLLAHKFIDQFDLVELIDNSPMLIADCIKTNPKWY